LDCIINIYEVCFEVILTFSLAIDLTMQEKEGLIWDIIVINISVTSGGATRLYKNRCYNC
jgi:hypothetical protein